MGKTLGDPLESLKTYSSNLASNVGGSRSEVCEGGVLFCWTLLIFRKNKKCERKRVVSSVENQGLSSFCAKFTAAIVAQETKMPASRPKQLTKWKVKVQENIELENCQFETSKWFKKHSTCCKKRKCFKKWTAIQIQACRKQLLILKNLSEVRGFLAAFQNMDTTPVTRKMPVGNVFLISSCLWALLLFSNASTPLFFLSWCRCQRIQCVVERFGRAGEYAAGSGMSGLFQVGVAGEQLFTC